MSTPQSKYLLQTGVKAILLATFCQFCSFVCKLSPYKSVGTYPSIKFFIQTLTERKKHHNNRK